MIFISRSLVKRFAKAFSFIYTRHWNIRRRLVFNIARRISYKYISCVYLANSHARKSLAIFDIQSGVILAIFQTSQKISILFNDKLVLSLIIDRICNTVFSPISGHKIRQYFFIRISIYFSFEIFYVSTDRKENTVYRRSLLRREHDNISSNNLLMEWAPLTTITTTHLSFNSMPNER